MCLKRTSRDVSGEGAGMQRNGAFVLRAVEFRVGMPARLLLSWMPRGKNSIHSLQYEVELECLHLAKKKLCGKFRYTRDMGHCPATSGDNGSDGRTIRPWPSPRRRRFSFGPSQEFLNNYYRECIPDEGKVARPNSTGASAVTLCVFGARLATLTSVRDCGNRIFYWLSGAAENSAIFLRVEDFCDKEDEGHRVFWSCSSRGTLWPWRHDGPRPDAPVHPEVQKSYWKGRKQDSHIFIFLFHHFCSKL